MRRGITVVLSALVFGVIAGTTMVGMNMVAEKAGVVQEEVLQETEGTTQSAQQLPADTETKGAAQAQKVSSESGKTVADIADEAMPSVVAITNMIKYQQNGYSMWGYSQPQEYEVPASGSGIIIGKTDDELLIVTNNHVVEDSSSLSVTFLDNQAVDASIKGTDSNVDLAVIAVKLSDIPETTLNQIKVAEFGDSDSLKVGEQVVAIGNALGYGQSVTTGIISAKDRTLQTQDGSQESGLLQTDAAINPGNSGGALLDMNGKVIGINVAKYASTTVEGMGYAIPSAKAQGVVENLSTLKTREEIPENERGYLGVQVKNIDAQTASNFGMPQGIFVYKIVEGGAAAQSDLKEKDIITAVDGQGIKTYDELQALLTYYRSGETITLTVQRASGDVYEEKKVSVTLGTNPNAQQSQAQSQQSNESAADDSQQSQQNGQNGELWKQFEEFFKQYQNRQ